jgi:hypothetical protein
MIMGYGNDNYRKFLPEFADITSQHLQQLQILQSIELPLPGGQGE